MASAQRALQRQAIEWGERIGQADEGVALARKLAILTYRTPEEFAERLAEPTRVVEGRARAHTEDYLDHMGARHSKRITAIAYRRLSESIDCHRIDPAAIPVPTTFVAIDSDQLVPLSDTRQFAEAVTGARFVALGSRYGHDAFLKEEQAVSRYLHQFLDHPEPAQ